MQLFQLFCLPIYFLLQDWICHVVAAHATAALQLEGEDRESRFTGHGAAYDSNISPIPESDELEVRSGTWVGLADEDLLNLVVK